MLTTDCGFLENELMDVVRLFKSRPQSVTHASVSTAAFFIMILSWTARRIRSKTRGRAATR